ncbi:FtsX-like permease family protein [Micrococcaceae bacterium Sec5.7]
MALDLKPVPGGRRHSFRVAMRMARRDIRRHRGRSLLIILLIMLPVAGMSGAATLAQSMQETPAERARFQLGNTQARFRDMHAYNTEMVQDHVVDTTYGTTRSDPDPDFTPTSPKDAIPAGYQVLTETQLTLTARVGAADVRLMSKEVDALNPAFAGKYTLMEGRAPETADEVLVSRGLLERFSLKLGEKLTTSAGTFAAVGKLRDATYSDGNAILFLRQGQGTPEEAAGAGAPQAGTAETLYYLVGPEPVTWAQIRELNRAGVAVLSRSVALDPPSRAELGDTPVYAYAPQLWGSYLIGGLIGALALLEVGLLAGAAFAVGAKRQVRELALLAASGAEATTVRAVVTAAGLWLGAVAVVCGAVLGTAGAAAVVAAARYQGSVRLPGFHPDSLLIAAAMAMGLLACALAALVPARQVARQAVLGALKSGRVPSVTGRWPARIGVILLALAVLLLASGACLGLVGDELEVLMSRAPLVAGLMIGGAVLTVTALVLLTGSFVALLTSRTGWLPLPLRMAARDSARNRSRTVPAVAAILAAATLASAVMVVAASQLEDDKSTHFWSALKNQAVVGLTDAGSMTAAGYAGGGAPIDAKTIEATLQRELGTVSWTQALHAAVTPDCIMGSVPPDASAESSGTGDTPGLSACTQYRLAIPQGNACPVTTDGRTKDASDWRCQGAMYPPGIVGQLPQLIVGGADELRAVLGREPGAAALAVLDHGGIVASNRIFVGDGRATLQGYDIRAPVKWGPNGPVYESVKDHAVAAVVEAPEDPAPYYGVISPDTASSLGIRFDETSVLVQLSETPGAADTDKAASALAEIHGIQGIGFRVEEGNDRDDSYWLWLIVGLSALITLSAAGITTGLALADARSDHMTLAGVGAPPRLRKALAGGQALMTAALGTMLGLAAGVVPAALVVAATRMYAAPEIPWLQLLALLIAVPLTGSALAWLFTRARLPMSRRTAGG